MEIPKSILPGIPKDVRTANLSMPFQIMFQTRLQVAKSAMTKYICAVTRIVHVHILHIVDPLEQAIGVPPVAIERTVTRTG